MQIGIHDQRNANDKNQQPSHDVSVHKRATRQYDAQQGNRDICYRPMAGMGEG